jgi:hypothetical protein
MKDNEVRLFRCVSHRIRISKSITSNIQSFTIVKTYTKTMYKTI